MLNYDCFPSYAANLLLLAGDIAVPAWYNTKHLVCDFADKAISFVCQTNVSIECDAA